MPPPETALAPEPTVVLLICADRETAAQLAAAIAPRGRRVIAAPFGAAAIERASTAGLIVVDRVEGSVDAVVAVERVRSLPGLATTPLLAIAQTDDVEERIRLLEAGADDVVSRPVDADELELRLEGLLARVSGPAPAAAPDAGAAAVAAPPEPIREGLRLVAFLSSKGGAGTTTLAVNCAVALARTGRRVALIDLDLQCGQVATHLNLKPRSSVVELVRDDVALDDPEQLRSYAEERDGLSVFCAPHRPDQADLVAPDDIRRLLTAATVAFDVTVIDAGSTFDERLVTLVSVVDRVALVATPEIPALRAIFALLEALDEYQASPEKQQFVLNHLFPDDMLSRDDIKRALGGASFLDVPYDAVNFHQAVNEGIPVVVAAPRSLAAERMVRLAATLAGITDVDLAEGPRRLRLAGLLRRG
jgi:pilus assembly protein CpaE